MKINGFVSLPPKTPYAPTWDFTIGTFDCKDINLKNLIQTIKQKEEEIKKLPCSCDIYGNLTDGYTGLGVDSTTAKFTSYNLLKWNTTETNILRKHIKKNLIEYNKTCGNETPDEVWVQCWVNILSNGQSIKPHSHSTSPECYLSGHFNVQTENTSTIYMSPINQLNDPDVIAIENKENEMTLFPSYIFHYTTPHYSQKERITIAFDLSLIKRSENWIRV